MTHKLLVTGAGGVLGRTVMRRAAARSLEVVGGDFNVIDITDAAAVRAALEREQPTALINAAAYTDVDACETPEGKVVALRVNGDAPGILAQACRDAGVALVHISTDYVFNGTPEAGVAEDAVPAEPMNAYGKMKRVGERRVIDAFGGLDGSAFRMQDPRAYLVRTSWLFGQGGKNFIQKITELAKTRDRLRVVTDEIGCPTFADDLADTLLDLLQDRAAGGIYHLTSPDICSRMEFARFALDLQGVTTPLDPASLADFPRAAHIANQSILKNTKRPSLPPWKDMVRRFLTSSSERDVLV